MLSTDTWSNVFSFLTIEDVESCTEAIVEARPAFEVSIFTVAELRPRFRMHLLTSKKQALQKFKEIVAKGSEGHITDWKMKILDSCKERRRCEFCGTFAGVKCSRCMKAHYCSRDCQKSHWKSHKFVCERIR